ncbi:Gfo/Idh/MocA family oxidoreductase [Streptomyces sp. ME02-8801-2C]|nr:Gfo/Idh/MocA family oxidoreductase [Streptomyces sp. ME02-8801-2C]
MLGRKRSGLVVVCSVDRTHDDYIVRALEAGCDVVTEKPMTTVPGAWSTRCVGQGVRVRACRVQRRGTRSPGRPRRRVALPEGCRPVPAVDHPCQEHSRAFLAG